MPLIKIEQVATSATIGIWKATENPEWFLEQLPLGLLAGYDSGKFSESRKREFLASRFLLKKLLRDDNLPFEIINGKLTVMGGNPSISISHSKEMMAVIVSENQPAGIDIEEISPRVKKIMSKFLNPAELFLLGNEPELWRVMLAWSAKESIYKMMGVPGISFANDILLDIPQRENDTGFDAMVKKNGQQRKVRIFFERANDFILTYCLNNDK